MNHSAVTYFVIEKEEKYLCEEYFWSKDIQDASWFKSYEEAEIEMKNQTIEGNIKEVTVEVKE